MSDVSRNNLSTQVTGPTLELAAKVKAALDEADTVVSTTYGDFYVRTVELAYAYGPEIQEIVGYLVPDEGDGTTFDFYTPKSWKV